MRAINVISLTVSCLLELVFRIGRGDVVLVVTNPPTLPLLAAFACRLRRAKFVLLVHDVYPDAAVVTGILRPNSFAERLVRRINQTAYRAASIIVVIGRDMKQRVASSLLDGDSERIMVITNWGDTEEVSEELGNRNRFRQDLGLSGHCVVQYAGNMGRTHDVDVVLDAAHALEGSEEIQFLFVGSGARWPTVVESLQRQPRPNVHLLPRQPRELLAELLDACDLAVLAFIPGMAGISVPSRMYNIMAAGKPIVAAVDEDSELAQVIREEGIGWTVPAGDADALARVVRKAAGDRVLLKEMGRRARHSVEIRFSYGVIMAQFKIAIANIES